MIVDRLCRYRFELDGETVEEETATTEVAEDEAPTVTCRVPRLSCWLSVVRLLVGLGRRLSLGIPRPTMPDCLSHQCCSMPDCLSHQCCSMPDCLSIARQNSFLTRSKRKLRLTRSMSSTTYLQPRSFVPFQSVALLGVRN